MNPDSEVKFEAGGKAYTLHYGNRAFRLFEREAGKPIAALDPSSVQELTVMVWAGLQSHHAGISIDDVDDVIDAVGYARLAELAEAALRQALPEAPAAEGDTQGNGRAAGTGRRTRARLS